MNLNTTTSDRLASAGFVAQLPTVPRRSLADGVVLHHLETPGQIARVLHLREEIDLSVHAAAGPQFLQLEKKETSAVSCSVSSSTVN
ncbi:MAG: hypothetical protein ACXWC6_07280 [Ramlibacter sp.]